MPVAEVSLLPSSTPGVVPQTFREFCVAGTNVQGEWCAANAPWLTKDRGAHHARIASSATQKALAELALYMDMATIKLGHIDRLYISPNSEDEGFTPALKAPVLSVTIWTVSRDKKASSRNVKEGLDAHTAPYRQRGGWGIEKDQGKEDIEEFLVIGVLKSAG
ncbi:hypothetical protein F5Y05DRAFT_418342 [Hypoxylon sp. FL0543]|nr:hypothetical protein F5Y05DRAFT_418342 [Hypoxylon sp. FL0543]